MGISPITDYLVKKTVTDLSNNNRKRSFKQFFNRELLTRFIIIIGTPFTRFCDAAREFAIGTGKLFLYPLRLLKWKRLSSKEHSLSHIFNHYIHTGENALMIPVSMVNGVINPTTQFLPRIQSTNLPKNPEKVEPPKKELEKAVSVSEEAISKIKTSMESILSRKQGNGIKLYKSVQGHRVFSLDIAPGLVFKMNSVKNYCSTMSDRYKEIINGQSVIEAERLGLLVIPKAKLFTISVNGEEYEILAEEKLDIVLNVSARQESLLKNEANSFNEVIRQLAVFICRTGYRDVCWRNNPILEIPPDKNGNRKIGLIDIEYAGNVIQGLFGDEERPGLVKYVNEEQAKIIKTVAE